MLGDLGADVIKIENRGSGDPSRGLEPGFDVRYKTPRTAYYEAINRNKRGISVDIGKQAGRELVYALVGKSDVFLCNFRPSVVERYRMGYDVLSKHNPRLIYAMVTGFGPKGPDADHRCYDAIGQARSALMAQCDPDEPHYIIGGIGDCVPATMCACGVITALLERERSGMGQRVDVSQLSSLMYMQLANLALRFIGGYPIGPRSRRNPMNPLVNSYRCADGKWMFASNMEADKYWPGFCKALGIEELQHDPRFNSLTKRAGNAELVDILDRVFATRTRDEWLKILWSHDLVFDKVNGYEDLLEDIQVQANNYLPEFDHPVHGKTRYPPIPIELSRTPASYRLPAPEFGQHTEEVLMELLGHTWDDIGRLKEEEII
jgi:crotonobetainyl-CoA:carnitine CoA-transferase CaiB-like acyl-CoA transferase